MAVQSHVHIDTVLGGAPENAPTNTYKSIDRRLFFGGEVEIVRGSTGKLFFNTFVDGVGNPLHFTDEDLTLFVTQAELEELEAMVFKSVYFVDHIHPNDGADHTAYVRTMKLGALKYLKRFDPMLAKHVVAVSLVDDDTV